ncbi:MAG: dienelactone hydrolase family protein [Chlamydiales bacterium]|nr:dienelactone hydrolase family protein [Chlamydiales bacterium]
MLNNLKKREVAGLEVMELPGDPNGPTIILLHGFGANAMDLVPLSKVFHLSPQPTLLFPNGPLEIPIAPGYSGRAWFPIDIEALQKDGFQAVENAFPKELSNARERIQRLVGELYIPRSKLIIGGFSQGAVLAVETALHGIERVAALLIFSGTLINEHLWRRLSHQHPKTPFFQSHGRDDPLLPLGKAEELEALLIEGGFQGRLHIFNGGHEIPQVVLAELITFLKSL